MPQRAKPVAHLVRWLSVAVLVAATSFSAEAKKPRPTVLELRYDPQQTVAATQVNLRAAVRDTPVRVQIIDDRGLDDATIIGDRTDGDDNLVPLRSEGDVIEYVRSSMREIFRGWGIKESSDAPRELRIALETLSVSERNQALGATYAADVRFKAEILDGQGAMLAGVIASGDASRYGRAYSAANASEVISDALLEAVAGAISDSRMQAAWVGKLDRQESSTPATRQKPVAEPGADPVTPEELLAGVLKLQKSGFAEPTVLEYVRGQTLTSRVSADEMVAWRAAGISEAVIRTVVALPVAPTRRP